MTEPTVVNLNRSFGIENQGECHVCTQSLHAFEAQ
jgi:hypothetical protein